MTKIEVIGMAIDSLSAEPNKISVNVEYDVEYLPDKDGIHQAKATITKAEPVCETCRHNDEEWYSTACDSCCGNNSHYEPNGIEHARPETIKDRNELLYKIQSEFEAEEARAFADQTKGLKEHAVWNKAIRILEEYIV